MHSQSAAFATAPPRPRTLHLICVTAINFPDQAFPQRFCRTEWVTLVRERRYHRLGSATNVYKRPRQCEVDPTRPLALPSGQLFEQGLRLLEVGGVEAFSERFVNW
jgi:hypothetical protein